MGASGRPPAGGTESRDDATRWGRRRARPGHRGAARRRTWQSSPRRWPWCPASTTASRWSAGPTWRRRRKGTSPSRYPSDARLARTCSAGSMAWPVSPVGMRRATTPLIATSACRRHEACRSLMSATRSSANSSPYRARQSLGYQRSRRAARRAAASDPSLTPRPSRRDRLQPQIRHAPLGSQMGPERCRPQGRQPVGAAPIMALHRLDESLSFEPAERFVQGARREPDTREALDILGQGVAVLGPIREAGENQGRRARRSGRRFRAARRGFFPLPSRCSSSP